MKYIRKYDLAKNTNTNNTTAMTAITKYIVIRDEGLFLGLSICMQDNSKSNERLLTNFWKGGACIKNK